MSTTDWLSAFAAVASATAGVAAAVAAFKSAKSAEESRRLAETVELRALLRDIEAVVASASSEVRKIEALVSRLHLAASRSAIAMGTFGGSRERLSHSQFDAKLAEAQECAKAMAPYIDGATSLRNADADDAARALRVQRNSLSRLQAISAELAIDLNALEGQQLQYLQATLNTSPPR